MGRSATCSLFISLICMLEVADCVAHLFQSATPWWQLSLIVPQTNTPPDALTPGTLVTDEAML